MDDSNGAARMQVRLTAYIAIGCLVVAFVMSFLLSHRGLSPAHARFLERGRAQAQELASLAGEALRAGDVGRLRAVASAAAADPEIHEVSVIGPEGELLASSSRERSSGPAPRAYRPPRSDSGVRLYTEGTPEAGEQSVLYVVRAGGAGAAEPAGAVALRLSSAHLPAGSPWAMWRNLGKAAVGVAVMTSIVYWLLGWLLRPVARVQGALDALARGEIHTRLEPERLGPLSQVGAAANRLGEAYTEIAGQVAAMTDRLQRVVARVAQIAADAEAGSQAQGEGVSRATALVARIEDSVRGMTSQVAGLSRSTEEASSSVLEMGSSVDEVARSMDSLRHVVESASASSQQMGTSIRQVADSSDEMGRMAEGTAASMSQMDRAVQQMSEHAHHASELTERVSTGAEEGSRAVATTIDGINDIRALTLDTKSVLERLAGRIGEIGEIVDVIGSINDETNLLSLNAAIIAAQAGEQGKAFAVVANHVKTLAERTSSSTQQIARLIQSVQDESANAMQAMEAGIGSVETGVQRSQRAGEVLEAIRASASEASTRVSEIARAVQEQGRNSRHVAESAKRTSDMVQQISNAMTEQSRAAEQMLHTSESSLDVCRQVYHSTSEQRETGRFITESITAVSEMMREMQEALTTHGRISASVAETVEEIVESGRKSGAQITELVETVDDLRADAEALVALLGRFQGEPSRDATDVEVVQA